MLENIFNFQTKEEKAVYTWEYGTFLASRMEDGHAINLYSVDDFFVEIWYTSERKLLQKVDSYSTYACFEPYLEDIVICS
jgi:hypothetical protein